MSGYSPHLTSPHLIEDGGSQCALKSNTACSHQRHMIQELCRHPASRSRGCSAHARAGCRNGTGKHQFAHRTTCPATSQHRVGRRRRGSDEWRRPLCFLRESFSTAAGPAPAAPVAPAATSDLWRACAMGAQHELAAQHLQHAKPMHHHVGRALTPASSLTLYTLWVELGGCRAVISLLSERVGSTNGLMIQPINSLSPPGLWLQTSGGKSGGPVVWRSGRSLRYLGSRVSPVRGQDRGVQMGSRPDGNAPERTLSTAGNYASAQRNATDDGLDARGRQSQHGAALVTH